MASLQQLPALTYNPHGNSHANSHGNDLRIVLVSTSDDGLNTTSELPLSEFDGHDSEPEDFQEEAGPHIPTHPISSLQDAFEESVREVISGTADQKTKLREFDAKTRRERLLEQPAEATPLDAPWRYRPGQQQHEVYKLIAQITFGVHLLLNGLAADETQVVSILQEHINEVDEFLEVTLEDFAQAHKDLSERVAHLQLPMANRAAFEDMLEDRDFRAKILAGNLKIEHILARTHAAMKQWDDDIDAGLRSSEVFIQWLNEQKNAKWRKEFPDLEKIFTAMQGNSDGWLSAFDDLNTQAQELNGEIIKLMTIVAEMEKTAGEVSRKTWATIPPFSLPLHPQHGKASSTASPRSVGSNTRSTPRASIRSGGSVSTLQATRNIDPEEETLSDFPLPGALPLLPPTSFRVSKSPSGPSISHQKSRSPSREVKQEVETKFEDTTGIDDGPLFILQPRTYTPKLPEPLPSPMVKNPPSVQSLDQIRLQATTFVPLKSQATTPNLAEQGMGFSQKRTSLRNRVSLKTTPPESIHIPPRQTIERQSHRPSTAVASPQTAKSQAHDSAYGSDSEHNTKQHHLPRASSHADFSMQVHPPLMPSPRSDHQQYYHPVRASPHSPLQQRPHTAGPAEAQYRSSGYHPGHQRNQPSRMGGMSMLSNVTMATYDDRATVASSTTARAGGKGLKKKRSTFGWLKKAFSRDEDEKAEYQARKAMQYEKQYDDGKSPKFLDGKRVR